ncbi:MAG TPA: GPP34 family phosphoprotein [Prolixibacteraceae bacterium]|nr:GPP34 family phosphoprotein [Prolixibacteraceae bacterium]
MENNLTLSEKLLLLAIRPEKGGLFFGLSQTLEVCLTGALLLEMELTGHVSIREKRAEAIKMTSSYPLYAYILGKMEKSSRPRKIGYWLSPFILSPKKIKTELYRSLAEKRQIRLEDRRFLFFTWKKPFLLPSNSTWRMTDHLKNLMFQDPGNPEDLYLAALLEPAEMWKRVFSEWSKRREIRRKIRQFMDKPQTTELMQHAADAAIIVTKAVRTSISARRAASS